MYQKGEYVVYGAKGVCQVGDITKLDLDNIPRDRDYYVLYPRNGGKIYVPVDKAESKMRSIITREQAEELVRKMPEIEPLAITNEKTLEELYKKCLRCYDCIEWIRLLKCIYKRKERRLSQGKKATAVDEKYMHMAEDSLYWELGTALDIPKDQIIDYIFTEIGTDKE